jgi:hypothetical protein
MSRAAIIAVTIGMLTLIVGSTAGSAAASSGPATASPDHQLLHTLTFNRAINAATKVARKECNKTSDCIAYGAGPQCSSVNRHKWLCPIHIVRGVAGDQTLQQDCHRDAQIFIKSATGLFWYYRFQSPYACGPNIDHPGF